MGKKVPRRWLSGVYTHEHRIILQYEHYEHHELRTANYERHDTCMYVILHHHHHYHIGTAMLHTLRITQTTPPRETLDPSPTEGLGSSEVPVRAVPWTQRPACHG